MRKREMEHNPNTMKFQLNELRAFFPKNDVIDSNMENKCLLSFTTLFYPQRTCVKRFHSLGISPKCRRHLKIPTAVPSTISFSYKDWLRKPSQPHQWEINQKGKAVCVSFFEKGGSFPTPAMDTTDACYFYKVNSTVSIHYICSFK